MSTENKNTENAHDSYGNVEAVHQEELDELTKTKPLESVVRVVEKLFQPHILLTDIDGNKFWRPFNWEPIEQVREFHKFELEASKIFREKARTPAELDELRLVLNSTSVCVKFYEMGDEAFANFMTVAICNFAEKWYANDHNGEILTDEKEIEEKMPPYHSLVAHYIRMYCDTVSAAVESSSIAAEALSKENKPE